MIVSTASEPDQNADNTVFDNIAFGLGRAAPLSYRNGNIDLNALAQRRGELWFGTAADIPGTAETTDAAYLKVLRENFGEMTPANAMKVCPDRI